MNLFTSMVVWVRFPKLPVENFNKLALFVIARIIGKPIKADDATNHIERDDVLRLVLKS